MIPFLTHAFRTGLANHAELYGPHHPAKVVAGWIGGGLLIALVFIIIAGLGLAGGQV